MAIYLDANVFYNAYCPIEERFISDWVLRQLTPNFPGLTSEWTIAEMFRAFKKQINLERIEQKDAQLALNLFLSEIGEYIQRNEIILIPVKMSLIMASRPLIYEANFYAADAVHLTTAMQANADAFITFDGHFSTFTKILVLNPKDKNFKSKINQMKANSQD